VAFLPSFSAVVDNIYLPPPSRNLFSGFITRKIDSCRENFEENGNNPHVNFAAIDFVPKRRREKGKTMFIRFKTKVSFARRDRWFSVPFMTRADPEL